jgi:hypothetical protein
MATVSTLKSNILNGELQDADQTNYTDTELWNYFNQALDYLSKELAKFRVSIAQQNTTLTYATGDYAENLPAGFLELDFSDDGSPRVFNTTDADSVRQMGQADQDSQDWYEAETASDTGTPDCFYFRGNQLLIHPRPDVSTTVKIYYYKTETITNDSSTVPWNGVFDRAIEQFVMLKCRARSEQVHFLQYEDRAWDVLKNAARAVCRRRDNREYQPQQGWQNTGRVSRYRKIGSGRANY